ncbi:MAG: hypothetical protein HY897_13160 [Deltaproteobacteria bacterium]|nr:hypothetical protein [Deltaproteobacteria bacterium]
MKPDVRRSPFFLAIGVVFIACGASSAAGPQVVASFPSSFPSPDGLTWDGEFLWATDCSTSRIDKVDPETGDVVSSIDVAGVNSDELAFDGEHLWITDHTATEMPGMSAPPPAIYRIDRADGKVLRKFAPPGQDSGGKFPMGIAWDGKNLWNIDTYDVKIYKLDPATGSVLGSIPAPAGGSCGIAWDGACLWVSDASTNGLIYHIDPKDGTVIRSFDAPGGDGHQSTGLAWDGRNLWNHDEQVSNPQIFKLQIDDPAEGGRCAPPPDVDGGTDGGGNTADTGVPADVGEDDAKADAGVAPDSGGAADAGPAPDVDHEAHHADGSMDGSMDGAMTGDAHDDMADGEHSGCSCATVGI